MRTFDFDIDDLPDGDELTSLVWDLRESDDDESICLMGEYNQRRANAPSVAQHWYELAAQHGHTPAILALARLAAERDDPDEVRSWLQKAADRAGGPVVGMAFDALGVDLDGIPISHASDGCNWGGASFTVVVADPRRAAEVIEPLLPTFQLVDSDGSVITDEQYERGDHGAPSFAFPLEITATSVLVVMDVQGEMTAPMGRTYVRLMSEALTAAGMSAQIAGLR